MPSQTSQSSPLHIPTSQPPPIQPTITTTNSIRYTPPSAYACSSTRSSVPAPDTTTILAPITYPDACHHRPYFLRFRKLYFHMAQRNANRQRIERVGPQDDTAAPLDLPFRKLGKEALV
ncbi:hypothetical protein IQ06DRAFT_102270 [Phaeosphaeriaceae sp. SRC1lsM3a]|nr:hypothetical protein IQ06DRAFT_102270 [Stagonospora sp. SRC1lsM3a]